LLIGKEILARNEAINRQPNGWDEIMKKNRKEIKKKALFISKVGITTDVLSSRGGLNLFVRYIRNIGLGRRLQVLFGSMRKSEKGQPVIEIFKQLLCNFVDGTSRHLVHFDAIRKDTGYAGTIESRRDALLSSHSVKRFINTFSFYRIWLFRHLLQELFIWRLRLTKPKLIELFLDTMVMDNDDAERRHGVQPTYKKRKGFQPLQLIWGRFIIDMVFRGGKKHSNHGDTAEKMVRHMVRKIRKKYRTEVPIIIKLDSGFFDQKLFEVFEELDIGYICGGKLYGDIREYVATVDGSAWKCYRNSRQEWEYIEFMDRRGSWSQSRRAIYCRQLYDGVQQVMAFARDEAIMYTNIGMEQAIDGLLADAGLKSLFHAEKIIEYSHSRGRDELVHRAFKDFGYEELPFKRFAPNAAYYSLMALAFFLFEAFKEDVCSGIVPVTAYATTVRRKLIDIAAKIVATSDKIILKLTRPTWERLKFDMLWERSGSPPQFMCV
jgi:hypothetical protein